MHSETVRTLQQFFLGFALLLFFNVYTLSEELTKFVTKCETHGRT